MADNPGKPYKIVGTEKVVLQQDVVFVKGQNQTDAGTSFVQFITFGILTVSIIKLLFVVASLLP